jgi:hypothetical protein
MIHDVTVFGADPTGRSDSTAAFQAAIVATENSGMTRKGGQLYVPSGRYLVKQLKFRRSRSIHFYGAGPGGTVISQSEFEADGETPVPGYTDLFVDDGTGVWSFLPHFAGFRVEGRADGKTGHVFRFDKGINRNLRFQELQILVHQLAPLNRKSDGFHLTGAVSCRFEQIEILDSRYAYHLVPFDTTPSSQVTFINCKSERALRGWNIQATANPAGGFTFINCKAEVGKGANAGNYGYFLQDLRQPVFIKCSSEDEPKGELEVGSGYHYFLKDVEGPQFLSCAFSGKSLPAPGEMEPIYYGSLRLENCDGAVIVNGRAAGEVYADAATSGLTIQNLALIGSGEGDPGAMPPVPAQLNINGSNYDICVMYGDPAGTASPRRVKRLVEYVNAVPTSAVQRAYVDGDAFARSVDYANGTRLYGIGAAAADTTGWGRGSAAGRITTPSRAEIDGGLRVGSAGLVVTALLGASENWNPNPIPPGEHVQTTLAVAGATTGSPVTATHASIAGTAIMISAVVSAPDVVTVTLFNPTAAAVDLGNGALRVYVFRP